MRSLLPWSVVVVLALAVGCAGTAPRPTATGSRPRSAPPGHVYQLGKASWYGAGFQGRPTASGERFDQHALTAAHRKLPFGTVVRVTNRLNGRSVLVRINDRGPHGRGLIIDVSYAAARQLGMLRAGVVPCQLEIVSRPR